MTRFWLGALYLAILTLAACSQPVSDPAKSAADRAGATPIQQPASGSAPADRGGGGGGDGGGY
jgi:hypothetical protein